nr:HNH endonuclease [Paracoccus marcusii]
MQVETPQSFVVREECEKAAWQNGFRRPLDSMPGWACFASTTVPGMIYLAASGSKGPWFLALDHSGVAKELGDPKISMPGPGLARFQFATLGQLYAELSRVYQLAASLPDAPLALFQSKVKHLPQTTEAERLVVQRIGQDIFRTSLMDYWQGRCPLTGITDRPLLRASHIVPWKDCTTNAERLNVHNGLLLSALWDAAFDRGLVTFDEEGQPEFSPALSEAARNELHWRTPLRLTYDHRVRLTLHRTTIFLTTASAIGA